MENRRRREPKKSIWNNKLMLIAIASVLAGLLLFGLTFYFSTDLDLQLNGDPGPIKLVYGKDQYQEAGATAMANGKPVEVFIEGSVNVKKLGVYKLTYYAEYLWLSKTVEREVHVIDTTAPVIKLNSIPDHVTVPGEPYEEEGFTATDDYDGDITNKVVRTEKDGKVIYKVKDSSGNEFSIEREIVYADVIAPEIVLNGANDITLQAGETYHEPGYTATDDVDGDITDRVQVSGTVDSKRAGTYTITYTVIDSYGNTAEVTRIVRVKSIQQPDVVQPGGKVIYLTFDDGPGPYTQKLLDILAKYNVKATFFVVNTDYNMSTLLNNIVKGGHAIGIHSVTHEYDEIYASEDAFFEDLYGMQAIIERYTGVKTMLSRFPGGSLNAKVRPGLEKLTQSLKDQGFRYFDWHVDSEDWKDRNTEMTVQKVISGIGNRQSVVVLQHDIHPTSVDAVEQIILWGLRNGYSFQALNTSSPKCEQ